MLGKIKYWLYWALLYMLNLFYSIVHCKPNLDVFIKRFGTTEPTKDVNSFFDVLQELHSKKFTSEGIDKLKGDVSKVIVLLERDCPIWLCNITTHLVRHIVEKINDNVSLYSSWMYPFERMNSCLTKRATNRSKTEECIMETTQVTNIL